jgi:hypothetical protein
MAFIGTPLDTRNTFQSLVGKRFNGDGSTTAFTLDVAPSSTLDIEVFVGNVRQDPNSAYTLSGTTLTFTGAPPSGTNNIYVVHQAKSVGTIDVPASGVQAGSLNSAVLTGQTDIGADIADSDLFLIDDGAGGTLRKTAASRIKTYAGGAALDDITTGDAASTLATSAGNITIDAQGGDTDIIFKGTDSSSDITALTIDMSDGGILQTRAGVGFPATQVASTGANVLDEYEEGTFTPSVAPASGSFSAVGTQLGFYTKIGKMVHVQISSTITTAGSASGTTTFTNLPFASAATGVIHTMMTSARETEVQGQNDEVIMSRDVSAIVVLGPHYGNGAVYSINFIYRAET